MLTISGCVFCPGTSILADKAAYKIVVTATTLSSLWLPNRMTTTSL